MVSSGIPTAANQPASRRGLRGSVSVAAGIVLVALTECLIAYWWLPSPRELDPPTKAWAANHVRAPAQPVGESVAEIDLGHFDVTVYQPSAGLTFHVSFRLAATVLAAQHGRVVGLLAQHQHRFRQRVIQTVRNADASDLAEPDLGLIRRRILATSSDLFGERVLRDLTFSNFRLYDE